MPGEAPTRRGRCSWLRAHLRRLAVIIGVRDSEAISLVRARAHISFLERQRTEVILTRVRLVALMFSLLTLAWVPIDLLFFPPETSLPLVALRVVAAAGLAALAGCWSSDGARALVTRPRSQQAARRSIGLLLSMPIAFQFASVLLLPGMTSAQTEVEAALIMGYACLPFIVMAGLAIFPLTLLESLGYSLAILGLQAFTSWQQVAAGELTPAVAVAAFWLLFLLAGIALLASCSQLAFIIVMIRDSVRDGMTKCFSRQSGAELAEIQFAAAKRQKQPMAIGFIDIDKFKSINDTFGHDIGDQVLIAASAIIRATLRVDDSLVRWGGEELLVIMPNTSLKQAGIAMERLRRRGMGTRPDGILITASVGIAERIEDDVDTLAGLIELADARMYLAKKTGRDRIIKTGRPGMEAIAAEAEIEYRPVKISAAATP